MQLGCAERHVPWLNGQEQSMLAAARPDAQAAVASIVLYDCKAKARPKETQIADYFSRMLWPIQTIIGI